MNRRAAKIPHCPYCPTDLEAAQALVEHPWKIATPNFWRQPASARWNTSGKLIQRVLAPRRDQSTCRSRETFQSFFAQFAQPRTVRGLAWRGVTWLPSVCLPFIRMKLPQLRPHGDSLSARSDLHSYGSISEHVRPPSETVSHRGCNHPPSGQLCDNLSPPLMFLE